MISNLINKIKNNIAYKIFFITSTLLLSMAFIIYTTMYIELPNYYYRYKAESLEKGVKKLVGKVDGLTFLESKGLLDEFCEEYNVQLTIYDLEGNILYIPFNIIQLGGISQEPATDLYKENPNEKYIYLEASPVKFEDRVTVFKVNATLQPIDEAATVILRFAPYIGVIILLMSIISGYIYSKLISKPLIQLNYVAKRMIGLDFDTKCEVYSQDELGQLSNSLNELSFSLQNTMNELTQANKKLRNDIERERELEEQRKIFVATISHELKTPITAVKGQLEGMIYNIGSYKDRDKYLKRSFDIMEHMEKLVYEMMEIYKLESTEFKPSVQNINISNMVYDISKGFEYFLISKDLTIVNKIQDNLYIKGDQQLIRKAISNVVNNAVKYSKEKEKVIIRLYERDSNIVLEVLNTGAFIEEEELTKVFEPFYRLEKSRNRNTGGSGLGLYIVKKILELNNISYELKNVEQGVLFTIIF